MTNHRQLKKLRKIIDFYEQDCEVVKRRVLKQNAIVVEKQNKLAELNRQLELTQQRFNMPEATAFDYQLVCHLMNAIETSIKLAEQELAEAMNELHQQRTELQRKMSKIESLERLCTIKTEEILTQDRRREQHLADERYLNTNFTG